MSKDIHLKYSLQLHDINIDFKYLLEFDIDINNIKIIWTKLNKIKLKRNFTNVKKFVFDEEVIVFFSFYTIRWR